MASIDSNELENILINISEKYVNKIENLKNEQDKEHLKNINELLEKLQLSQSQLAGLSNNGNDSVHPVIANALGDVRDRQSKIIDDIKDAHNKQLDILRHAIADERKDAAAAQQVFEKTLQTKYDNLVVALQEKIKDEQEVRLQRALDELEKNARIESERAKQSFETQQTVEKALSAKFKSIVGDLRHSWEEEELARAKQMEERLRSHYSAVLEHMEAQLKMALQLNDEADKQWMADVEARNKQQISIVKAFEAKCKRLYDTRLADYVQKTDEQLSQYEQQLLDAGGQIATERSRFESRQRRLQIACSRWKLEYQKELHSKYADAAAQLEAKYMDEITKLMEELSHVKMELRHMNSSIESKERDLTSSGSAYTSTSTVNGNIKIVEELIAKWDELGTSSEERVGVLVSLLNKSTVTPTMMNVYQTIANKLSAKLPITQMLSRKQYIEYKLKYAQKNDANKDVNALSGEYDELSNLIDGAVKEYETKFQEKFESPIKK